MLSSFASFLSGTSSNSKPTEFDPHKCSTYSSALYSARIEAAVAKAILFDASSSRIGDVLIGDMKNLIERLHNSAPNVSESQQNRDVWKELPALIDLLSRHPANAKLVTLSSLDGIRVASVTTAAASLVKDRTEQRQIELLASLDQATRGRFKAAAVVDAESRRSGKLHTLLLSNLIFDSAAKNALRNTLRNHQIVVLDLTNCFLGDDETISLLKSDLSSLSQLSVLSLRGNALTNGVVPYFISSASIFNKYHNDNDDHSNLDISTEVAVSSKRHRNNNNNKKKSDTNANIFSSVGGSGPAYLESNDKFLSLRVLILDDNEIASRHLINIKATLAHRWQKFVEKYDPNSSISYHQQRDNHSGNFAMMPDANNTSSRFLLHVDEQQKWKPGDPSSKNFFSNNNDDDDDDHNNYDPETTRPTTTILHFRNIAVPSVFLSLDGNGVQGIAQAKFLAKNPQVASPHETPIECIVATSSSVIIACALALGNISLENVCNTFKLLQEEVFSRSEADARHYVESAGMYIRSWWYGGEYYSSAKARIILDSLFGTAKFSDFPCSRVIAVMESSSGQVLYASSPTSSPLWNQCHTFLPSDPYCPSVTDICLAAMAAPGRFAPRMLPKSRQMTSAASAENNNNYVNSSNNNGNGSSPSLLQPPSENIIVFDACGSTPNPSHIALIECMRPTTKPRRLVSIATENETQVSALPEDGIASISAAALSDWPNARVVLAELASNNRNGSVHGNASYSSSSASASELHRREEAYTKLLANHSYIARASSISVERALDSTLENEEVLRTLVKNHRMKQINNKFNGNDEKQEVGEDDDEVNQNADNSNEDNEASRKMENNTQEQHNNENGDEEDSSMTKKKHVSIAAGAAVATSSASATNKQQQQQQQQQQAKNPIRTSSTSLKNNKSTATTAVYYERLFPSESRAPELKYDETSTRMLAVAILDQNVAGYEPHSSKNFNRFYDHYHYDDEGNDTSHHLEDDGIE